MPSVPDTFVDARQNLIGFATGAAPLRRFCLLPSRFGECLFVAAEESGVGNKRAIREGGELVQTHVDTDRLVGRRQSLWLIFAGEAGEPFTRLPSDGASFRSSEERSVSQTLYLPDFRDMERGTDKFTACFLRLWERDAIIDAAPFQTRVAWRTITLA